jgi:hypothetical protein
MLAKMPLVDTEFELDDVEVEALHYGEIALKNPPEARQESGKGWREDQDDAAEADESERIHPTRA